MNIRLRAGTKQPCLVPARPHGVAVYLSGNPQTTRASLLDPDCPPAVRTSSVARMPTCRSAPAPTGWRGDLPQSSPDLRLRPLSANASSDPRFRDADLACALGAHVLLDLRPAALVKPLALQRVLGDCCDLFLEHISGNSENFFKLQSLPLMGSIIPPFGMRYGQ